MEKKKFVILFIALAALLAFAVYIYPKLSDSFEAESLGQTEISKAQDFTVYDSEEKSVTLSEKEGKYVVVNFWASWCSYCIDEMPYFEEMSRKYSEKIEFMMVDITDGNEETRDEGMKLIEEEGYSFPVYFDEDQSAALAYSITSIPVTLFIDSSGNLFYKQQGAMDKETLEENIKALLNGTENEVKGSEKESKCSFH